MSYFIIISPNPWSESRDYSKAARKKPPWCSDYFLPRDAL